MYKKKLEKAAILLKKNTEKLAFDFAEAVAGNPFAMSKSIYGTFMTLASIRDMMFWDKVDRFLRGMDLTASERQTLRGLFAGPDKEENVKRLIQCIDNIEAEQTIDFLANATRALIEGDIKDRETYFRICYVMEHTLYEDLCFLRQHIGEENMAYGFNVQGLLATGLMYVSSLENDGTGNDCN